MAKKKKKEQKKKEERKWAFETDLVNVAKEPCMAGFHQTFIEGEITQEDGSKEPFEFCVAMNGSIFMKYRNRQAGLKMKEVHERLARAIDLAIENGL